MKYVVANWKMNLSVRESIALVRGVLLAVQGRDQLPEVIICPSFTALFEVNKLIARSHVKLGAQNVGPDRAGALTGEIGIAQLEDVGCTHVLLGHSERRLRFREDEALVHERILAVLASELTPIVCVGETASVRASGQAEDYVLQQLKSAFNGLKIARTKQVLIAYEPVWAIGSEQSATPAQVVAMHTLIREYLVRDCKLAVEQVTVLYGGSIDSENAYQFLREPAIDGLLVGGASLNLNELTKIIMSACQVMEAQTNL